MFAPAEFVDQESVSPTAPPPVEIVLPTGSTVQAPAVFDP
jgi:hypothetical protein